LNGNTSFDRQVISLQFDLNSYNNNKAVIFNYQMIYTFNVEVKLAIFWFYFVALMRMSCLARLKNKKKMKRKPKTAVFFLPNGKS
jgi:hypothetical protein